MRRSIFECFVTILCSLILICNAVSSHSPVFAKHYRFLFIDSSAGLGRSYRLGVSIPDHFMEPALLSYRVFGVVLR